MKTLTLSLLATFCTLLSFGQSLSGPTATLPSQTPTTSQAFLSTDRAQFASLEQSRANTDYYINAFRESSADQCAKFHKLKTVGIILSAVGGGLFVTGIALIAIGEHDAATGYYNGGIYYGGTADVGLVAGGAVCMVFGLAGMGAGIPLAIIGSVKSKRYCGGGGRAELQFGTNGHNLAMNF